MIPISSQFLSDDKFRNNFLLSNAFIEQNSFHHFSSKAVVKEPLKETLETRVNAERNVKRELDQILTHVVATPDRARFPSRRSARMHYSLNDPDQLQSRRESKRSR